MRIAFLADIHGNLPALEAVLQDLDGQSPDAVYLGGDQVNRCPWSNEVMDLIEDRGWRGIRGNHEVVLSKLAAPHGPIVFDSRSRFPDLWWTLERLGPRRQAAIDELPGELSIEADGAGSIRIVHGVPGNPFRGLFLDTGEDDVAEALANVAEPVIVAGHTHRPLRRTVGRWLILNGGSVGVPYNGDPRAQYLVLTSQGGQWAPSFRRVAYAVDAVRDAFIRRRLDTELGPWAAIHLRTIESAQPWASDFNHWLNQQMPALQGDVERAFTIYEQSHGPGKWSFMEA